MSENSALIGERLGSRHPFKLEAVLGAGAMGVVYRASDEKTGRTVAVKVLSGELAKGTKINDRFRREFDILDQFRHPGIVRNLSYGRFRGTRYIAMEFIQGQTLEQLLQERGALPWREVVDLAIQVCDALQYAHERGVVHRDLKPSNLMVTPEGKVKLTDFGIAKDLDAETLTATGRTLGTAAYMSPEQIRGTPAVSHKTDLYALGVVLYQLLAGKPPFEGGSPVVLMHCHLNEPPARPSAKVAEIPRPLDDLIVTLMAKSPADRPWDATAVMVVLTELRDKADRGAAIPMVWPSPGAAPARAGAVPTERAASDRPKRKPRKTGTLAAFASTLLATRSRSTTAGSEGPGFGRAVIETALLVLALVAIGGFIIYWVWPPGQGYLYQQAQALMASTRRADWLTARDDYIKPLNERFPQNPYREQTRNWLDRILLTDAEGRAGVLIKGVKPFSDPTNDFERQFIITYSVAADASSRGDDLAAARQWRELAGMLQPQPQPQLEGPESDDPDRRQWHLLALHRADQVENAIHDRRQLIEKQLQLAAEALRSGRAEQAVAIQKKLVEQYAKYTDLADLFATPPASSPAPSPPSHPPANPSLTPLAPPGATPPQVNSEPPRPAPATSGPRPDRTPSSEGATPTPDSPPPREAGKQSASEFRS